MTIDDLIAKLPRDKLPFSIMPEEMRFLHHIVQKVNPSVIVELGTCAGGTTAILNNAAPKARLHTYDIVTHLLSGQYPIGWATKHLVNYNVNYHPGQTSFNISSPHDLCWIDANHFSPEVLVDALNCIRFARFPYTLSTHDVGFEEHPLYHTTSWNQFGSTQLWKALAKIKDQFHMIISEHIYSRAALIPRGTDKWTFTCALVRAWRLHRDMDNISNLPNFRLPTGGPDESKIFKP